MRRYSLYAMAIALLIALLTTEPSSAEEKPTNCTLVDGQEVVVNGMTATYQAEIGMAVVEGDIELAEVDCNGAMLKSLATGVPWSGGFVPYEIGPGFTAAGVDEIRSEMARIDEITPLTFQEVSGPSAPSNRILITHQPDLDAQGSSSVGAVGGAQRLRLQDGNVNPGVLRHEVWHAIGFHHEHSRDDRDQFIVMPADVDMSCQQIVTWGNALSPYDYSSVTHYPDNLCPGMIGTSLRSIEAIPGDFISAYDRRGVCDHYSWMSTGDPTCEIERTAVVETGAGCPTGSTPFTITMETSSSMGGWAGQWSQSGTTRTMRMCELQHDFRNLRSDTQLSSSDRDDMSYAVMRLGEFCPPGAQPATLFAAGTPIAVSGLSPEVDPADIGLCVFSSPSQRTDGWTMDGFPDLGDSYGVFGMLPLRAMNRGLTPGYEVDDIDPLVLNNAGTPDTISTSSNRVWISEVTGTRPEIDVFIDSVSSQNVQSSPCKRHLTINFRVIKPSFAVTDWDISAGGSGYEVSFSATESGPQFSGTTVRELGCSTQGHLVSVSASAQAPPLIWPTRISGSASSHYDPCGNPVGLVAADDDVTIGSIDATQLRVAEQAVPSSSSIRGARAGQSSDRTTDGDGPDAIVVGGPIISDC